MQGFPLARAGDVIGLLGGSFDPAHEGHVRITRTALARFGLDRVWWLVSPGNPLKARGPAPMASRMAQAQQVMADPRVTITALEAELGTRYTAQTLRALQKRYPGVRFVWLMGADNLEQLPRWRDWQGIMGMVAVGVLARPGHGRAGLSQVARQYRAARLPATQAGALGRAEAPAWCLVSMPLSQASSSAIRAAGGWRA